MLGTRRSFIPDHFASRGLVRRALFCKSEGTAARRQGGDDLGRIRTKHFADIARGIREVVQRFQTPASGAHPAQRPARVALVGGLKEQIRPQAARIGTRAMPKPRRERSSGRVARLNTPFPNRQAWAAAILADEESEAKPEDVPLEAIRGHFFRWRPMASPIGLK